MRTPFMAGNWKMYKTPAETTAFFNEFLPMVADAKDREIVINAPYVNIAAAVTSASGSNVGIGAQNLFWEKEGAYTGEISGPMLKASGCQYVVIGHSERRQYFGETDATVLKRAVAALEAGLIPIVCVGELLEEREAGRTNEVLQTQFDGGLAGLDDEQFAKIVIAYEPVWAIGTGKTATPEMAGETHQAIRALVAAKFGADAATAVRILYGGSVKPNNVKDLMAMEDIDGGLVGGASLEPASFAAIVNF
ncbi:MAG: triose-phosphate isomerase [Bryobacterales bacterium]|nr:triose-phosphate isomerase [Bryobacterales bacterium]